MDRARRGLRTALISGALLMLVAAAPAQAGSTTPYNKNLVANPGAEDGDASATGYSAVTIPGWTAVGTPTVIAYGMARQYPSPLEIEFPALPNFGGQQFFASGPAGQNPQPSAAHDAVRRRCGILSQTITINGRDAAIDAGLVRVVLKAYVATRGRQPDTAHVSLVFRDALGRVLTTRNSGPLAAPSITETRDHFRLVSASRIVPRSTRMVRVTLSASNAVGYCDAYFDNIRVTLAPA
jgi:hypothetical protein